MRSERDPFGPAVRSMALARPALFGLFALGVALGTAGLAGADAAVSNAAILGIAVDRDTGEPIAHAHIFEVIPGEAPRADIRKFDAVRSRQTDNDGTFRFDAESPSMAKRFGNWLSPPREARFHFYHPTYGLIWGRESKGGQVRIEATLRDAHLRQADATGLCLARRVADELREIIREIACPPATPERYENGLSRAEGPTDSKGRRSGQWIFRREDGSIAAIGQYKLGGAVGEWGFHPNPSSDSN